MLIEAVWTEVEDRLRQSLHNAILIRLDMAEHRSQVSRPWDSQLCTADQSKRPLAPNTHIATVFDRWDVGGKLLILGNPGAGKTTTMLDLAAVLIQRANDQPDHPVPVMFNLSSWSNAKQSITEWLLRELKLKYGVSPKLGQKWLTEKTLLPLLDGLDELPPKRQESVAQDINEWLQSGEGPTRLLVCSRIEEYELYAKKLLLNGAICLEPLTDGQLQDYLNSLKMGELWDTLKPDEDLLVLLRTPLLLSVAILANQGIDLVQWRQKQTTQERMQYLLDAYVERRLHEGLKAQEYPPGKQKPTGQQTRRWLIWLAMQLKTQDEFLIETMQPGMLATRQQRWLYRLLVELLVGLISGLIFGLMSGLMSGLIFGLIFGLIGGLLGGPIGGLLGGRLSIDTVESFDLSLSRFKRKEFLKGLQNGLIYGLIVVLIGRLISGLIGGLIVALIGGLIVALISGLISGLIGALKADVAVRVEPNQGIRASLHNTVILLAISIPFAFILRPTLLLLLVNILEAEAIDSIVAVAFTLVVWSSISDSITACVEHFALRLILHSANSIPWNYAHFLSHCTERLLLQRVGGRYRFIHKLVQEHFAVMPLRRK